MLGLQRDAGKTMGFSPDFLAQKGQVPTFLITGIRFLPAGLRQTSAGQIPIFVIIGRYLMSFYIQWYLVPGYMYPDLKRT